jgi:hypothetical protein
MPWFNVDDSAHSHPKIVKAGNAAFGLWTRCGSYVAQHLTDGIVPGAIAEMYGTAPTIKRLVAVGLWHQSGHACAACPQPDPGDFYMHDYTKNGNPLRAEVLAKRAKAAEKKRRLRAAAAGPQPPNPGRNRPRIEDESRSNRGRIEDESSLFHTPVFDEPPDEDDVSRGDSLGTRARAFHSTPLHSLKEDVAEVRERSDRSGAREPQAPLSQIPPDWTPSHDDRDAAAADLTRLGPKAAANATAKFIRHHQGIGTRRIDFGPAWVTWLARERPDTQGAFLVGLPGGGTPTPTPPSYAERMAELDAAAARDDRDHDTG